MLQIKRINFTTMLDAQVTAICKHAEHAPTPVVANQLYELAEDFNRIAANIARRGLTDILNSPLPNGRPINHDADEDLVIDEEPEPTPTPAAEPTPPPPPLPAGATQRQAIQHYIRLNPGVTAKEVSVGLEIGYATAANECKALFDAHRLRREGKRPMRYFIA